MTINILYTNGRRFIRAPLNAVMPTGYKESKYFTRRILRSLTCNGYMLSTVELVPMLEDTPMFELLVRTPDGEQRTYRSRTESEAKATHLLAEKKFGGKLKRIRGHHIPRSAEWYL